MFVERQTGPIWLRLLGVGAAAVVVIGSVGFVQALSRDWGTPSVGELVAGLIVVVVIVGLAAVTGLLASITVRVANGRVVGRLAPFRVFAIPVGDIMRVDQTDVSLASAGGIGYRLKPSTRFLLFDGGAAVEVESRGGRTYFIRSNRGAEMASAIARAREALAVE